MRKVLSLFVAALLVFSLAACTSSDVSNDSDSQSSSKSSTDRGEYPAKISNFSSTDVYGSEVSEDIFKEKKYTVINFWATYCSPCINEMADLQEWSEEMDDDVQLVGVLTDVKDTSDSTNETAKSIIETTGVEFTNIIASGGLSNFASTLVGVPTTIIVDSSGQRVGDPIVGAQFDVYKDTLEKVITQNA